MPTEGGRGMGWFSKPKGAAVMPDRLEMDNLLGRGDGQYETGVRGESQHRDHLVAVLARLKRAPGWADGRVPVRAFLVPLGREQYGNWAVEIEGQRVGFVEDSWVKLFGDAFSTAAAGASKPVVFACDAAICWKVSRGNPLKDAAVPVGVRLDLESDAAVQEQMRRLG